MKRTLFTLAVAALTTFGVAAQTPDIQDIFDSGTNKASFGVRLAWDLNSPSTDYYKPASPYQNGSGLSAGAFYSIPLYKNLYFEPGINFFYNTMIISYNIPEDILLDYPLPPEGSLRNCGLRVPFNFGYRFDLTDDISLSVFTGPQVNFGLSLKQYDNFTKTSHSLYGHGWHRWDAQWLIGVRFHYADNWIAEISGGIGMSNLLDSSYTHGAHFRRNTFSIGVGYIF